jgi:hypothetical protein
VSRRQYKSNTSHRAARNGTVYMQLTHTHLSNGRVAHLETAVSLCQVNTSFRHNSYIATLKTVPSPFILTNTSFRQNGYAVGLEAVASPYSQHEPQHTMTMLLDGRHKCLDTANVGFRTVVTLPCQEQHSPFG